MERIVIHRATTRRWFLLLLAALIAVWTVLGLAGTASAATHVGAENRVRLAVLVGFVLGLAATAGPAAAQTRVGPQPVQLIMNFGPHQVAAPEDVGVHALPLRPIVSATGVATNAGGSDWPELSGVLRDAAKGKGNFGLGADTQEQATAAGEAWVGPNASLASDGKTLVSQDRLRQFQPPSYKPNLNQWQANFEWRESPNGAWQGNGHLNITDPP
jgi:hypothetical protein